VLVKGKRPRELHWFHAGPMLFGDWGTSRLYVLGLAFCYTGGASLWFMGAMSLLLIALGWAYQIICRTHPDGGGVYSSAKHVSPTLAVVGGLLLCADYVVTAALSSLDAFHYLNFSHAHLWSAGSMILIGAINFFGPRKSGTLALLIALMTVGLTLVVAGGALPWVGEAQVTAPAGNPIRWWAQFTSLILAISGVEAVANMTGIMVKPVAKTSRRSILPVVTEIVILNVVLTLAMLAVPREVLGDGDASLAYTLHRDDMMRAVASYYIGPGFAAVASMVFAALLLSAANTALTDLVSIQYMLSRDREMPELFERLNRWGMPLAPLVAATVAPVAVVLFIPDMGALAELYAIGVAGAVAVNLWTTSINPELSIRRWERRVMLSLGVFMTVVWVTIAYDKPRALVFATSIMTLGLTARFVTHNRVRIRAWVAERVPVVVRPAAAAAPALAPAAVAAPAFGAARKATIPVRILVPTRGNPRLVRYALEEAKSRGGEVLFLFVRHIAVPTMGHSQKADPATDTEAVALFDSIKQEASALGVPAACLYAMAWDVADAILEFAVTYGVDVVLLGATRRSRFWHMMKGDVTQEVVQYLPENITLLFHA
jgi:amino acid transporter/nucleotide-binding universal stress UspA family protein